MIADLMWIAVGVVTVYALGFLLLGWICAPARRRPVSSPPASPRRPEKPKRSDFTLVA